MTDRRLDTPLRTPGQRTRFGIFARIALVGLAQVLGAWLVSVIGLPLVAAPHIPHEMEAEAQLIAAAIDAVPPAERAERIRRLATFAGGHTRFRMIATARDARPEVGRRPSARFVVPLRSGGALLFERRRPPVPMSLFVFVLGLSVASVVIGAFVLARALGRPLAHLTSVARALGRGSLSVRANLVRNDELGELGAVLDHTASRLEAAQRAQRELLANVSHELRSPLARIRVALDLAADGDLRSINLLVPELTQDVGELEQIVSDVLQTARLDFVDGTPGALPPLRSRTLFLAELLDAVTARFHAAHPSRSLTLEIRAPAEYVVHVDPVLLRRAVENLLDNAARYSAESTPVNLRVVALGACLELQIEDRGIGMTEDECARVGTPFFRTDASRERSTGGVGLGISLARRVAEAHAGSLDFTGGVGAGVMATLRIHSGIEG